MNYVEIDTQDGPARIQCRRYLSGSRVRRLSYYWDDYEWELDEKRVETLRGWWRGYIDGAYPRIKRDSVRERLWSTMSGGGGVTVSVFREDTDRAERIIRETLGRYLKRSVRGLHRLVPTAPHQRDRDS